MRRSGGEISLASAGLSSLLIQSLEDLGRGTGMKHGEFRKESEGKVPADMRFSK
jgi:hypothetical protein